MANVNIKFNGKDYLLSCDDGQEESLKKLTTFLDSKYLELKKNLGNIGENKLLLITSIKLIDEHFDLRRRISEQKNKLDNLSKKFKELRSLAIKYKDVKEIEIKDLNKEIDNIKKSIEEANNMYENMLDKTTESLEKIIKNAEKSSNIQQ
jgi:cell division protein ZapA